MFSIRSVIFSLILSAAPKISLPKSDEEKGFFMFKFEENPVVKIILEGPPQVGFINPEGNIEFWHYLNGEKEGRKISPNCDKCLKKFIRAAPTVFVVHGFADSSSGPLARKHRKAFVERGEPVNLIIVNWYNFARLPHYPVAAYNVKAVGKYIAKLIDFLIEKNVASLENITYIGHSLGAQVGNSVTANLKALDPALPLFDTIYYDESDRIDPSDADFVVVLHTSAGTILEGGLGFQDAIGHADFYPNSGRNQPGCPGGDFGSCSHSRAYYLMAESIYSPQAFPACKCDSWEEYEAGSCKCNKTIPFGWETPETANGKYFFETKGYAPYGHTKV